MNLDYLAFIQEQMECRRSKEEGRIGTDERATTEYLILSMCWERYLNLECGIYLSIDNNKAKKLWIKVEKYRKKQLKEK